MSNIIAIKSNDQYNDLIKNSSKIVFKYGAIWCKPCKLIQPQYESLSLEHPDVVFCTIDVDTVETSDINEIDSLPTFLLYVNCKPIAKVIGANIKGLEEELKK
jgi:thioredoxin 1